MNTDVATTEAPTTVAQDLEGPSKPKIARWEILETLLGFFDEPRYLEIGVSKGDTFHRLTPAFQVAVDPAFRFDWQAAQAERGDRAQYHQVTSDEYFGSIVEEDQLFDVIYLDGLHTFDQTLRDLTNALNHLAPRGVILIDDVRPPSYHASLPDQDNFRRLRRHAKDTRRGWMGDVYRLVWFIDTFYQSLSYATVSNNHGQAVVWRQRRESVTERSASQIAELSFESFVLEQDTLRLKRFGEILEELQGHVGR